MNTKSNVNPVKTNSGPKGRKIEFVMALVALAMIVGAWFVGNSRAEASLEPYLASVYPNAGYFKPLDNGVFAVYESKQDDVVIAYVAAGTAQGYGGEVIILAVVDTEAVVTDVLLVSHKETSAFMKRVLKKNIIKSFPGKKYDRAFKVGDDLDGVSGATVTCRALAASVKQAVRRVAVQELGLEPIPEPQLKVRFGIPEIVIILLFLLGFLSRARFFPYLYLARWLSLLTGLIFLGFIYNIPLTLVMVNKMLLGFWPQWQLYLYWYLLAGGVLLSLLIARNNPYCQWFCPFGAAQECLGVIGGGRLRLPERLHRVLIWLPRLLALGVIIMALIYRNPGIFGYEVFGAFFRLVGSTFLFALLAPVLILSLFMKRPWCAYLCPIRPVTDLIRVLRNRLLKS